MEACRRNEQHAVTCFLVGEDEKSANILRKMKSGWVGMRVCFCLFVCFALAGLWMAQEVESRMSDLTSTACSSQAHTADIPDTNTVMGYDIGKTGR